MYWYMDVVTGLYNFYHSVLADGTRPFVLVYIYVYSSPQRCNKLKIKDSVCGDLK
jgi:hypothetical protein